MEFLNLLATLFGRRRASPRRPCTQRTAHRGCAGSRTDLVVEPILTEQQLVPTENTGLAPLDDPVVVGPT